MTGIAAALAAALLVVLILIGFPIAFSFAGASIAFALLSGRNLELILPTALWETGSFALLALPLFIIAGTVMRYAGDLRPSRRLCRARGRACARQPRRRGCGIVHAVWSDLGKRCGGHCRDRQRDDAENEAGWLRAGLRDGAGRLLVRARLAHSAQHPHDRVRPKGGSAGADLFPRDRGSRSGHRPDLCLNEPSLRDPPQGRFAKGSDNPEPVLGPPSSSAVPRCSCRFSCSAASIPALLRPRKRRPSG